VAVTQRATFMSEGPLLLHWDGKLLPDITGSKEVVDRIAVLVTGGHVEQLLGVPKVGSGSGEDQCNACVRALDEWQLKHLVRGLVFDTTASNTGLKKGACILIEKALDTELIWIPCRHHVLEIMLSDVFKVSLGTSNGPDIALFKRFQLQWLHIDKNKFEPADEEDLFTGMPDGLVQEMRSFYADAIYSKASPRDDYRELLQLCHVLLGGSFDGTSGFFRAPGALHQARWMAKAIYSLKMFLFRGQMKLTPREAAGLKTISVFVALVYARFWHEAPIAERAPLNDLNLLALLQEYPIQSVRMAAIDAFQRHLWYFSEQLVCLSLFDDRVTEEIKAAMVRNFSRPANQPTLKRLNTKFFDHRTPLQDYVTSKSLTMFDILSLTGQEEAKQFLSKPPADWPTDHAFQALRARVKHLKVVNDCAERGIALITSYNAELTKDESQKQYLPQLVASHRKKFPVPTKTNLNKEDA